MANNGLIYLKEVAKYFMDFLETDFHKRKNPRRTIRLRNDDNLLVGIKLDKFPSFNDVILKSVRDAFGGKSLKQLGKGVYRSNISANLLDLIRYQLKNITSASTDALAKDIVNLVENYALSYRDEFDRALSTSLEDAGKAFRDMLVAPFIGSITKSLESAGIGDENSIYLMEEELTSILVKGIESKVADLTKQLIAGETPDAVEELKTVLELEEIKATLLTFFESYQVTDLFNEIFEITRNKSILETQELYLYFCDISFNSVKYPVFYIPVDFQRQGDSFTVEFDSHVYVNKKALEFIVQEYRVKTGKLGDLKTVKERIIYLANHENDFTECLEEILSEITGFFELDAKLNLSSNSAQTAKSQYVRISNACCISLFDKSDEALVNDYEDILRLLNEEDSELAKAFQKIIEDFINNDPESHISEVENEWDGLEKGEKLVFEAPIPLNEEQRQILMAVKRPGCNYVTVEGPPGTGKSHTITAIVCDCVLNDRPVLVLSDKKEALDVVEDKISDALNKVRHDKNFQNPILRLGKTGSTYAQILAPAVLNNIKTHYRAVRNDSGKLTEGIEREVKSLKEDIEAEILISEEIDVADILRCIQLEQEYTDTPPPIDLTEFLGRHDSFVELEDFRQIFGRLNDMFCGGPEAVEKCAALTLLKVPAAECHNTETLRKLIRLSTDLVGVANKVRERFLDFQVLSLCERLTEASFTKLQEFVQSYSALKSGLFGYLFKGGKVRALNERFKSELPLMRVEEPHKRLEQLQALVTIYNYAKANQPASTGIAYDFVNVMEAMLKQETVAAEISALADVEEDLKYLAEKLAFYPDSVTMLGIDHSHLARCSSNRLVAMAEDDFNRLLDYLTLRQKIEKAFCAIPDTDYQTAKSKIEKLVTVQMTYQMDERVINFAENNKATAKTLRDIMRKKQRFPREEFSKLKEAFPCILAGIRDYAEYIPLMPEMFDLVIIDEASQVSIAQAFPALLRAKKVLILGDKKQFSNVKASQARSDTNREYLNSLRDTFIKFVSNDAPKLVRQDNFNIKTSILEFFEYISNFTIQLNKYFRGYKEIISYSNRYFYKNSLQVMKIRGKAIDDVLKFEFIDHDGRAETVPKANSLEIDFVISELKRLKGSGSKSTVGIITPHTNQQKLMLEAVSKLPDRDFFFENMKLKVMTFDTCQGEERDIIYYSMVATMENDRLWGVFIKDLNDIDVEEDGKIKAQRLNVGLSRAKECMHFVVSKPLDAFKGSIGEALRHYWHELEESRKEPPPDSVDPNSPMEKEVLNWVLQTTFWQQNKRIGRVSLVPQFNIGEYLRQLDPTKAYQHPKYKVDFLLVYRNEKGREHKIIIEYDGFKEHFTNYSEVNEYNYSQYYSPDDVYRQKTLESYGYKFLRINKFNSGKNPIETLDKRITALVADRNGDVDVLRSIHDTIHNIQNKDAKECPKCKVIRDNEEFKDPACTTGYGRICVYCKGLKQEPSAAPAGAASSAPTKCRKCNSPMVLRTGRYGKFYSCSRYPKCNHVWPYHIETYRTTGAS